MTKPLRNHGDHGGGTAVYAVQTFIYINLTSESLMYITARLPAERDPVYRRRLLQVQAMIVVSRYTFAVDKRCESYTDVMPGITPCGASLDGRLRTAVWGGVVGAGGR